MVGAACLPLLAVIITRTGAPWTPTQDFAVIDLRVRDVWTSDIPLSGAYSRYEWNHPGPLMFYALAVPSLVFGKAAWATQVGGAVFQAVAIVWLGWATWRLRASSVTLVFMLVVSLSYASTGPWMVVEPWNPHLAFPWFVLFVFYAWRLSLGETARLPALVLVASVITQLHVGYVTLVIGAVAAISLAYWIDRRTRRPWEWSTRSIAIALTLFAVVWSPVAVDAVVHPPGNLHDIVDFFAFGGAPGDRNGLRSGLALLGHQFDLPPEWLTGDRQSGLAAPASPWLALVPASLFVVGAVAVLHTRRRADARLLGLLAVLFVYGLISLSRVVGWLAPYLFYWRIPLALLVVAATGLAVVHWTLPRAARLATGPRAHVVLLASVVIVALPVLPMTTDVLADGGRIEHFARSERSVERLADQAGVEHRAGASILVRSEGTTLAGVEAGIINLLDRAGVRVKVDEARAFQFGEGRGGSAAFGDETWIVLEEGIRTSLATRDADRHFVARLQPLRHDHEAAIVALQLSLRAALLDAGRADLVDRLDSPLVASLVPDLPGIDRHDVRALAALNRRVDRSGLCRCAIVGLGPGS